MTPEELVEALQRYRDKAAAAMPEVAMAMADHYKDHLTRVTLRRTYAAPGQFGSPAPPGSPIAYRTGFLARSVTSWPGASSGASASAHVAPHTVYSAVQEYGREIFARNFPYMRWYNDRGWCMKKRVTVPPRPYMHPALADVVADGSLRAAAVLEFRIMTAGWQY